MKECLVLRLCRRIDHSRCDVNLSRLHLARVKVYLPIFQTAGSVEVAVSMIQDHVAAFEAEEDPLKRGAHETALRKKIAKDVTVGCCAGSAWAVPTVLCA